MKCCLTSRLLLVALIICGLSWPAVAKTTKIVAFGTSFTAGKNVASDLAFPSVLEQILTRGGADVRVLNYGVSGDTTADLLDRVKSIPSDTDIVILEYATGNDRRDDISTSDTYRNISAIVGKLVEKKFQV